MTFQYLLKYDQVWSTDLLIRCVKCSNSIENSVNTDCTLGFTLFGRVGVIIIVIVINCNLITFSKVIACNCN